MTADSNSIPAFGVRLPNEDYQIRSGSYAIIRDADCKIAVIRTPRGYFLPGGGAEPGETLEQTLHREVLQETGRGIVISRRVAQAVQFVFAQGEGHFAKHCTFFAATFIGESTLAAEVDHCLLWLGFAEAVKSLKHESQMYAVRMAAEAFR